MASSEETLCFFATSTCYSDDDNYLQRKFKGDSKMKKSNKKCHLVRRLSVSCHFYLSYRWWQLFTKKIQKKLQNEKKAKKKDASSKETLCFLPLLIVIAMMTIIY